MKDPLLVMTNVLPEKVPRENAESSSSLDSIEKNKMNNASRRALPRPHELSKLIQREPRVVVHSLAAQCFAGVGEVEAVLHWPVVQ